MKCEELYKSRIPYYKEEIAKCTYRQFTTGFFFGKPTHETQIYDSNTYRKEYNYLGLIDEVDDQGKVHFSQKNKFMTGDTIELMVPSGENRQAKVLRMWNQYGEETDSCPHPGEAITMELDTEAAPHWIMRQKVEE